MARTAGRSAEDTRRLILDTAIRLVGRKGTAVPVSEIAAEAGISKGGLL
ncbi:MAG: TetR family transcriptional regulator, partial [Dermabacteraceae bacterium]